MYLHTNGFIGLKDSGGSLICYLRELLLSWCESRLLCELGKLHCSVSHLRPPSLLVKPSVRLVYTLYIVLQKFCLEVFALLCWMMLAHKWDIYIMETHRSGFCLSLLGGMVVFVQDTWEYCIDCLTLMALLVVSVPVGVSALCIALYQLWYQKRHLL